MTVYRIEMIVKDRENCDPLTDEAEVARFVEWSVYQAGFLTVVSATANKEEDK